MSSSKSDADNSIGRRGFLRSLIGLGSGAMEKAAEAKPKPPSGARFFWADLKTGFIGFPDGLSVPSAMPGSLMKLVAAAALVDQHLINPNETYDCHGHLSIGKETIHCLVAHGRLDLAQAIGHSCNCFFAHASQHLSSNLFIEYAKKFGLESVVAERSGGKFPAQIEEPSLNYVLGLNKELEPTALQIMRMSALIALKGTVPYLHSPDQQSAADGEPFKMHLKEITWERLRLGMELACREGTARHLDPQNKMHIACKTGTAPHGKNFLSWITGYFPAHDPRHAFCLYAPGGTSQDAAVPEAHKRLFAIEWP